MSSGDGFAIKSAIAQIGNVARTQVKSQQVANTQSPATSEKVDQEQRVDLVRETEKTEKQKLKPDERNRQRRERESERDEQEQDPGEESEVGSLLDTKA